MAVEQAVSQAEHTINVKSHIHVLAQIYYYDIVHVGQCPLLQYLFISRSVYKLGGVWPAAHASQLVEGTHGHHGPPSSYANG